jgi:broad specificity phosphatase PhoE
MRCWLKDIHTLVQNSDTDTVVAITHGIAIASLLQRLFNFDPRLAWTIGVSNTSVTKIRFTKIGWRLDYLNRTPHLFERGF